MNPNQLNQDQINQLAEAVAARLMGTQAGSYSAASPKRSFEKAGKVSLSVSTHS
ncbi:hypothetical protein WDW86_20220 [Bdellovibrionota bacterium FG-2]